MLARHELEEARTEVAAVRAALLDGKHAQAVQHLDAANADARSAQARLAGPVWWTLAALPWLGDPADTVRGLSVQAHHLTADVLPDVLRVGASLRPDELRVAGDTINLRPLTNEAPAIAQVHRAATAVQRSVASLPNGTWLPPADHARDQLLDLVGDLTTTLGHADTAAQLLPPMLGGDGPRTYLVVFENEAESRGLGGLPGAFAIVRADNGRVRFTRFGNDSDIGASVHLGFGPDFDERYGDFGTEQVFVNSTMTPHFPYVARIWQAMWEQQTGERLDGAIATDPTALSYLLRVTGPATLPDGSQLSADNVVALTENEVYGRIDGQAAQNTFFRAVARTAADRLLAANSGDARDLVTALARAARERRLLLWSTHADEESRLAESGLGGLLPRTTGPFVALAVNNAAGGKLDYYLDRSLTYTQGPCTGDHRTTTVTVRLTNTAPAQGLPADVTIRADDGPAVVPGTNRLLVSLYLTRGAAVSQVTVDGERSGAVFQRELGHPVLTSDLEIGPGATRTLVYRVREPASSRPVATVVQPLVRPMAQRLETAAC